MSSNSWRIGRIAGIEIRIDPSWTVIALLIAYSLFLQFTLSYPGLSNGAGILLAVAASTLFFGSVLAHELTHSLVARSRGIPVRDITLFIFGGVTRAQVDAHGPRDEFVVTVVGPLSSAVLAGVFWAASTLARGVLPHPVEGALGYLGWVNLILAGFNLLPGFPLDGGRVLRAVVWGATGDQRTGTRVATVVGEIIGYALLAFGAVLVLAGGVIGGIWFAAIGWFLAQSARGSYREFEMREAARGVQVEDVMERDLTAIPADVSLRAAADRFVARSDQEIFPVEAGGTVVGILTSRQLGMVDRTDWDVRRVRDVMVPIEKVSVASPWTSMATALDRLEEGTDRFIVVLDDGRAVGTLTIVDLARWLRRKKLTAA